MKGITAIFPEATDMGRPLYEKCGFVDMRNEMELTQKKGFEFRRDKFESKLLNLSC